MSANLYHDDHETSEPPIEDYLEDEPGFGDDGALLDELMNAKIKEIKAFKDPILQHSFEALLSDEEELLSLDALIAASKVRFSVAVRKGSHIEVAQLLRAITDGIEKALDVREKKREYVHLEQVLWLMYKMSEMHDEIVSNQDEVRELNKRMSKLVMIPRDEVPLEIRRTARALSEGRKLAEKEFQRAKV